MLTRCSGSAAARSRPPRADALAVWRLFTSPFFHNGFLHLALNMSAWVPLGSSLERSVGSVQFAYLTLLFALLGGSLHTLAGASAGKVGAHRECAVGLSGVIFSLVVVDSHLSPAQTRSLFGFVTVPTRYYPLALLAVLQLLLPSASLLGHLAGVLVGYAFVWGWLNWLVLSPSAVGALERARCTGSLVARPNFILSAGLPDPHGGGLPRWLTASGAADGGGVGFRTPAWLSRAWAQASAAAGMSSGNAAPGAAAAASGEVFAGRGRALGGVPGARPPWAASGGPERAVPPPEAVGRSSPAPSFAAARVPTPAAPAAPPAPAGSADARARAACAAEARALGLAPGTGPDSPAAAGAVSAAAAGLLPTGSARAEALPPGLRQLVEMGFPEDAARSALQASGGDISLALELLSTG